MSTHNADSVEQSQLEPAILLAACTDLGLPAPTKIVMDAGDNQNVDIDGVMSGETPTYLKAYISLGHPDSAQKHKLKADILKLVFISQLKPGKSVLVVTSKDAATWLTRGWLGAALKKSNIEVHYVTLADHQRKYLEAARRRQRQDEATQEPEQLF